VITATPSEFSEVTPLFALAVFTIFIHFVGFVAAVRLGWLAWKDYRWAKRQPSGTYIHAARHGVNTELIHAVVQFALAAARAPIFIIAPSVYMPLVNANWPVSLATTFVNLVVALLLTLASFSEFRMRQKLKPEE
jgi:hypothetical protein